MDDPEFTLNDRIAQLLRETEMLRAKLIRQETQIELFLDTVRKVLDDRLVLLEATKERRDEAA